MRTETRVSKTAVACDTEHLKTWLEKEYPKGIELYYVDHRDSLNENTEIIMELVRNGYSERLDESFLDYDLSYTFDEIEREYIRDNDEIDEIDSDLQDYIREWCYEHDTSNYTKDILRNTRPQLFFIDTGVEAYENSENLRELVKKFAKTDEQKKAVTFITNNQMYHSTIQFYFYADVADIIEAVHRNGDEYVTIDGALIGNVTRGNGSNWLSDDAVFKLVIPKKCFIENVYGDKEEGTGYGWHDICGDWNREECAINSSKTKKRGYLYVEGETSYEMIQEKEYAKKWKETGKCTFGDMNITRHKNTPYRNDYPCGNKCTECGTFWID